MTQPAGHRHMMQHRRQQKHRQLAPALPGPLGLLPRRRPPKTHQRNAAAHARSKTAASQNQPHRQTSEESQATTTARSKTAPKTDENPYACPRNNHSLHGPFNSHTWLMGTLSSTAGPQPLPRSRRREKERPSEEGTSTRGSGHETSFPRRYEWDEGQWEGYESNYSGGDGWYCWLLGRGREDTGLVRVWETRAGSSQLSFNTIWARPPRCGHSDWT
ncbi:hypothetical protein VTI74DRAFT_3988 [Chaetomium olivicolor]